MILIRYHMCACVISRLLCYRAKSYGYQERHLLADLVVAEVVINHLGLNIY